jgi:hypothetical protein
MPTYAFLNTTTGEIVEKVMKISELDAYKREHPNLQRYINEAVPFGDGMRMSNGVAKPDSSFEKYVINRIKESVPGNSVALSHKTKMPREW